MVIGICGLQIYFNLCKQPVTFQFSTFIRIVSDSDSIYGPLALTYTWSLGGNDKNHGCHPQRGKSQTWTHFHVVK